MAGAEAGHSTALRILQCRVRSSATAALSGVLRLVFAPRSTSAAWLSTSTAHDVRIKAAGDIRTTKRRTQNPTHTSDTMTDGMNTPLFIEERIRWSDLDSAGIMYFGNYIRLFEIAETELFRTAGFPYVHSTFESWNAWPLRASFHCDFYTPIQLDELVRVEIWIGRFGNASMTMNFRVLDATTGELHGEGYCTVVMVHREARRAVRIPDVLRSALEPFATPPGITANL